MLMRNCLLLTVVLYCIVCNGFKTQSFFRKAEGMFEDFEEGIEENVKLLGGETFEKMSEFCDQELKLSKLCFHVLKLKLEKSREPMRYKSKLYKSSETFVLQKNLLLEVTMIKK